MPALHIAHVALLILSSLFAPTAADEPVVIAPDGKSVHITKLPAHRATYVLYGGNGASRVAMQEIRRELEHVERDGTRAVRLTWHTHAMGREVVDELVLDAKSLAPLFRSIPMPTGGIAEVTFDGKRMSGVVHGADGVETERFERTYTAALHDASLPLLAALPKKAGARYRLATMPLDFAAESDAPDWTDVTIVERAPLAIEEGVELDAWVIELTPRAVGVTTKLWLADEEPFVLRKEIAMPGMGTITWELKTGE